MAGNSAGGGLSVFSDPYVKIRMAFLPICKYNGKSKRQKPKKEGMEDV